ncbi:hypothetical protein T10_10821 [Trichinella papuae]|uniref:Peptidase aspartic putative domain-containing protein n=1 Tax=Trichinella papuae TaxID=268474 RepID=A0A0V1M616_9BILA|nr:hypothetical protein T10_10821 [Trichinella papuae]
MNCYTEAALRRRPELLNHAREEITQHAPEGAPPNCMFADVRGGWPSRGRELFSCFIRKDIADALGHTGQCDAGRKGAERRMRRADILLGVDYDSSRHTNSTCVHVPQHRKSVGKSSRLQSIRSYRCADWADHYFDFIGGRVWSGIACGRVAVQSKLGWILCGQTRSKPSTELIAFLTRVEQLAKETF